MLAQHKDQQALGRCRAIDSPLARILAELIHNAHGPIEDMPEVAQIAGRREALLLGTHLDVLSTIKAISPLLGLLGTVIGMIQTFTGMSLHGSGDIGALAGGISTALITTATGLSIAIPALVLHKYFSQKVGSIVSDLEISAEEIIRLLKNRENRTDKEISEAQVPSRR